MNTWDYWPNGVAGDRVSKTGGYSYHFKEGHYAPDNNSRIWSIDGNEPYPTVLYYDDSNALTRLDVYYNPQFDTVVRWSDGPDLVLEARNAGGGAEQWFRYVHGPGSDQPLAMEVYPVGAAPVPGTGKQYYYHADGEGSIRLLTDANAQIANQYSYDSYGARLTTVESAPQPYGWKGLESLPNIPILFSRARLYAPQLGRFLSEDPLGYGGGDTNLYSFAWNNAKNWNDPTGMSGVESAAINGIAAPTFFGGASVAAITSILQFGAGAGVGYLAGNAIGEGAAYLLKNAQEFLNPATTLSVKIVCNLDILVSAFDTGGGVVDKSECGVDVAKPIQRNTSGGRGGSGGGGRGGGGKGKSWRQGKNPCEIQYAIDGNICRRLRSSPCWAQAAERYAACLVGGPIPPFYFQ